MPNEYGQNWKSSLVNNGTPAAGNSVGNPNSPPFLIGARHSPLVPTSAESVLVTVRVLDEVTTGITARIYFRRDGIPSFTFTNLFDDGQHGDAASGDGIFGNFLPGQTSGTIVEFYFEA